MAALVSHNLKTSLTVKEIDEVEDEDVGLLESSDHIQENEKMKNGHPPKSPSQNHHPISYRPDIDGLRAVAVLPVVLFHAYPHLLPGGFIGVDIFFVISGYLISGILFKEYAKGAFTYANFYSRRVRRIFPALILMLTFTISVGCTWLLAKPLKTMTATLVAGCLFGANLQLLTVKEDYFDDSVKENPLLHLWSLGVEEQFYIFWPFFVSLVVHRPRRYAMLSILFVTVASFVCNILFLGYNKNNKYSFYFPLSRFWQMAIGGFLSYIVLPNTGTAFVLTQTAARISSLLGLSLIFVGYVVIDETKAFPGNWAILPTLGAAFTILAGPHAPFNKYLLSSSALVFIGNISYPLYLWHWPMLVFAKGRYPNASLRPIYMEPYAVLFGSVLASIATYYLVENRLRRRKSFLLVPVLSIIAATLAFAGFAIYDNPEQYSIISYHLSHPLQPLPPLATKSGEYMNTTRPQVTFDKNGHPPDLKIDSDTVVNWSFGESEMEPTFAKILAAYNEWDPYPGYIMEDHGAYTDEGVHVLNQNASLPKMLVLGDSHGHMLAPRFLKLLQVAQAKNKSFPEVVFRPENGVPALGCIEKHSEDMRLLDRLKPKAVLYCNDWPQFLRPGGKGNHGDNPRCCEKGYVDTCDYQSPEDMATIIQNFEKEIAGLNARGIRVFVATLNPEGPEFNSKNMRNGEQVGVVAPVRRSTYRKKHEKLITLLEAAVFRANGTIVDFSKNMCWEDECHVISKKWGEPVFKDNDHIRPYYVRNYLTVLDQVAEAAMEGFEGL